MREVLTETGRFPASQLVAGWAGNAVTHPARRFLLALAARPSFAAVVVL